MIGRFKKPAPAVAEAGEGSPDKRGKRKFVPAAVTGALISLALLAGCGDNGSSVAEKAQKQEARQTKIDRNNDRLNTVLRPAAVNLAERAVKLSTISNPASNPAFVRYPATRVLYPPNYVTIGVTARDPKVGIIKDSAYITMQRVHGQPDPTRVVDVSINSKFGYTKGGQRHVWENSAYMNAPHIPRLSDSYQGDAWSGFSANDPTSEDNDKSSVSYSDTEDAFGIDEKVADAHNVVREARFIFRETTHADR